MTDIVSLDGILIQNTEDEFSLRTESGDIPLLFSFFSDISDRAGSRVAILGEAEYAEDSLIPTFVSVIFLDAPENDP